MSDEFQKKANKNDEPQYDDNWAFSISDKAKAFPHHKARCNNTSEL